MPSVLQDPNQQRRRQGGGGFNFRPAAAPLPAFPRSTGSNRTDALNLVGSIFPSLTQAAPQALDTGLGTLQQILGLQGATDPALFNRQLADISRTTQGQQDALQGQLSRLGIQNSGVGQALGTAIGAGGADRRAGAIAQEQALQEERKRSDLVNLLLPLLIQPGQQASSNIFGIPSSPGSNTGSALLGAVGTGIGAYFGGPVGAAVGGAVGSKVGEVF